MHKQERVRRDYTQKSKFKLCECGCGEYIDRINKIGRLARFKHGHNSRNKKHWAYSSKRNSIIKKISDSKIGHSVSSEAKKKMSIKSKEAWKNPEHREKCLSGLKKFNESGNMRKSSFKKGHIPHNKDKPHLPREKIQTGKEEIHNIH